MPCLSGYEASPPPSWQPPSPPPRPSPPPPALKMVREWEGVGVWPVATPPPCTRILKELGPQLKDLKKGEVILLDGGFPGRNQGIIPWPKPKKKDHPRWQAKYNDGHSFIRGGGEHPFAQWALCRDPCTKFGMNWEERILRLHWMVHAVVHTQQFINKQNVKYKPYGPWGHFPKELFGTKSCTVDDNSSTSDSDSDSDSDSTTDSDSGSSLTSCSPDSLSSGPNYSPDDE